MDPLRKASHVVSVSIIHQGYDGFFYQIKYRQKFPIGTIFATLAVLHFILEVKKFV